MKKRYEILPGMRFGKLTTIEDVGSYTFGSVKYNMWSCICQCGTTKPYKACDLRANRVQSCGCSRTENPNWGQKPIPKDSKYFFQSWLDIWKRKSTKRHDREFTLTLQELDQIYEQQSGKCYYTGRNLTLASTAKYAINETSVSIDRIDNSKGYTVDNVVLCEKMVNVSRNTQTQEEFIQMCLDVTENTRRKSQTPYGHPSQS